MTAVEQTPKEKENVEEQIKASTRARNTSGSEGRFEFCGGHVEAQGSLASGGGDFRLDTASGAFTLKTRYLLGPS
jgi:hypothetical protein